MAVFVVTLIGFAGVDSLRASVAFRLDRVACGALSDVEQLGSWAPPRHTENTGAGGGISPVGGADRIVEPAMLRELLSALVAVRAHSDCSAPVQNLTGSL